MLKTLVERGIDVNATDYAGDTAFTNAILNQCTNCARCLPEDGAHPNIVGSDGTAAMHFGPMYHAHTILHKLRANSAKYLRKKTDGETV